HQRILIGSGVVNFASLRPDNTACASDRRIWKWLPTGEHLPILRPFRLELAAVPQPQSAARDSPQPDGGVGLDDARPASSPETYSWGSLRTRVAGLLIGYFIDRSEPFAARIGSIRAGRSLFEFLHPAPPTAR